jgi:signal transduction histidine kinase
MESEILLIGIVSMLFLALGVIFFVVLYQRRVIAHQLELKTINQQKELELIQASIQSEEAERMRIASELHDDVGATLASARLFLYKDKNAVFDESVINQSKELLDESISKIRNISHKLQPATLQHLGLELSLQSFIETIDRSGKISVKHTPVNHLPRVAANIELSVYRISQELITNIIKHATATIISVETNATNSHISLLFTHNGLGLTQIEYEEQIYKKGSTGLKNIVNRVKSIDATLQFYKSEDSSFATELIIPISSKNKLSNGND